MRKKRGVLTSKSLPTRNRLDRLASVAEDPLVMRVVAIVAFSASALNVVGAQFDFVRKGSLASVQSAPMLVEGRLVIREGAFVAVCALALHVELAQLRFEFLRRCAHGELARLDYLRIRDGERAVRL